MGPHNGRDTPPSPDFSPTAKRQKISVACDSCRARKVRCDGNRPVCRQCIRGRKNYTCTYNRQPPETQQRCIQELGGRDSQPSSVARMQSFRQNTDAAAIVERHAEPVSTSAANTGPSRPPVALDEPQNVVFGESSSTTFLHRLSRHQGYPQQGFVSDVTNKVPLRLGSSAEKAGVLPRRRVADDILVRYWSFVHPLFPILHEQTFNTAYEKSWTSQPNTGLIADERCREFEEALFLSTLNIIFALAARFSDSIPAVDKCDMTREFYNRSRQIFAYDVLDCSSLPVLQMVLLQGIYLQSTTEVSRCWNVIGVATRMAQSLGLHLDQTYQRQKTTYAREMGRRLWHSCLVLDRLAAATFGWPMMVHDKHSISLPVLSDDSLSSRNDVTSDSMRSFSHVNVFTYACELFSIIGDILSTLYCNNGALLPPSANQMQHAQTLSQVMALNGRLEAYLITIPRSLRTFIEGSEQTNPIDNLGPGLVIQQAISCRYLYAKILLLRPALLMPLEKQNFAEEEVGLSHRDTLIVHAIDLCISSSSRILDILHNSLNSPYRVADWHVVYMTFTAVTSMLAVEKYTQRLREKIDKMIEISHEIFRYMEPRVPVSSQALRSLETIRYRVAADTETHVPNNTEGSVMPSVEQNMDGPFGGVGDLDPFDWLANPSALLSRQTPGLDMSWLTGSDAWFS